MPGVERFITNRCIWYLLGVDWPIVKKKLKFPVFLKSYSHSFILNQNKSKYIKKLNIHNLTKLTRYIDRTTLNLIHLRLRFSWQKRSRKWSLTITKFWVSVKKYTAWKLSVFGFFLVSNFPHLRKPPNKDTFHAVVSYE